VKVGRGSVGIACGRSVWLANYDTGQLLRIDPVTRKVTAKLALGGQPRSVILAAGSVWVSNQRQGAVARVRGG
jgi:YVTN family beta-propeller protein